MWRWCSGVVGTTRWQGHDVMKSTVVAKAVGMWKVGCVSAHEFRYRNPNSSETPCHISFQHMRVGVFHTRFQAIATLVHLPRLFYPALLQTS
jgi:hypothetical protein